MMILVSQSKLSNVGINREYHVHVFLYPATLKSVGYYVIPSVQKSAFECPSVRLSGRLSVCPYKPMGTPVAIKFGQLDTQVVIFEYK